MEKILAISGNGDGLLPMKQGNEQESKKTESQKNIETCNFIKNAFCIDGDVELVLDDNAKMSKLFFRCNDKKRGKFWVAYGKLDEVKDEN